MSTDTSTLLDKANEVVSEAAGDVVDGVKEAVNSNEFLTKIREWWENINVMSLIGKVLIAALILVLGILLAKIIYKLVHRAMVRQKTDPSVYAFVRTLIKFVVYIVAIMTALSSLGLNISTLLAALASVAVAIGLGLQNSVSQLVSGIIIIINKPFKNGDYIEVNGAQGTVREIHIMYTVMITLDNKKIIMPNSDITSHYIINFSAESTRRCDFVFNISYSDDIEKARKVILDVISTVRTVIPEPEPTVFVSKHDSSSIALDTRCWCKPSDYWETYFTIQERVKVAFDKNGVTIPFNQLDVHVVEKK